MKPNSAPALGRLRAQIVPPMSVQFGSKLRTHLRVYAAADLAHVAQLVPLVDGQDERADVGVSALAGLIPDDDRLLLSPDLDLQPRL